MTKVIHEFTKIFSILFLICSIFAFFTNQILIAILTLISFIIVKVLDSDFVYNLIGDMQTVNMNAIWGTVTSILIIINLIVICESMLFSSVIVKVTEQDIKDYITYENSLYSVIEPCTLNHNKLVKKQHDGATITEQEIEKANSNCYHAVSNLKSKKIPSTLPQNVQILCNNNYNDMRKIAVNLATYKYSSSTPQKELEERTNNSTKSISKNLARIRSIMNISENANVDKTTDLVNF